MKCNCQRWLWGIVPLLMLCWLAVHFERGRIEQDLAERSSTALSQHGYTWAVAAIEGRDIVLSGRAPDEDESGKAFERLRGTWGVRLVDNRADLLERAENYIWAASRRGQRIRLTGYAPSLATRQVIIGVVRANFPGFEIVDRTRLARGVPPLDTWLAGISFALRQLASLKRGDVRLDGLTMTVAGEAEDLSEYRTVKAALTGGLPKAIKLANSVVAAPSVSPHSWTARLDGEHLTLAGHVPDETAAAQLLALMRSAAPGMTIEDRMQPASGAAQGWNGVAAAALRALLVLKNGSAELKDATLTLAALATDEADLQMTRTVLRAELPEAFRLVDHIKSPAPLVVPPTPPLPPLPADLRPPPMAPEATGTRAEQPALPEPLLPVPPIPPPVSAELFSPPAATRLATQEAPPQAQPLPGTPPASPAAETPTSASASPSAPYAAAAASPIATQSLPAKPTTPGAEVPAPPPAIAPPIDVTAAAVASACQDRLSDLDKLGPILFRAGSAELEASSHAALEDVAGAAKSCPELSIEITGHASSEGGEDRNRRLSIERARSVLAYLVKAGVEEKRLAAVGYGAERPVAPNDSTTNMARNRRIEFVVHRR
jgi:outer membrane protein OmpA-like peptidoglycan-associated protein